MQDNCACADDLIGPLSYKKMKLSVLVLSDEIKKMPGKNIGVLLPATVGTYLVILAILFAKKTPVMLNWTLGPRYLNTMANNTDLKSVISSWKFLERLANVDLGYLIKKIKYIEDIKKRVSKKQKISGLLKSFKSNKSLLKKLKLDKVKDTDTAVILFTSGTEAIPKTVPLSHKNILSNQRAALSCVELKSTDILLGVLPPFSFFWLFSSWPFSYFIGD